jgi:pyruvate formate lyase activating enzyme
LKILKSVKRIRDKCVHCRICETVLCPSGNHRISVVDGSCIGCGACVIACPEEALFFKGNESNKAFPHTVYVNGEKVEASGFVKDALKVAGFKKSVFPILDQDKKLTPNNSTNFYMPCLCGGCWSCAVKVDNQYAIACLTPLSNGMKIELLEKPPAMRVVSSFKGHTVGGVGTPHYLKNTNKPIEIVCFTHGCNLYCPQCQNSQVAFTAGGHLMDPSETSMTLLGLQKQYEVDRIAISGGESTLNPTWLISVIKSIREADQDLHIHLDTNGTVLTGKYIDMLVEAGMTEIGIDLKAISRSTFMTITGIKELKLAEKYLKTSWAAVEYITENYYDKVFLGIGIPYNKVLISKKEIEEMGQKIASFNRNIQVSLLNYRGEFRKKELIQPSFHEMIEIKHILNETGLETVIAQTSEGHFGP